MDREKIIIKTSIIGILANIMLVIFKSIVGIISNSIAIVLDAVNNLSDVLSSVITIIGTKMAGKEPDKEHPYGHGRVEYITAMIISIIILYAGLTALFESGKKIIHPQTPDYTIASIIIVAIATVVKIILGMYVRRKGEEVNSESLIGSGKDALTDAVISFSTLVAAGIFITFKIKLDAWIGLGISIIIIKTGIDMLKDTLSQILGRRVDRELAIAIKNTVNSNDEIYGTFDLILNDYGPDTYLGSLNIEVPDTMKASDIDDLSRRISKDVFEKHKVMITAIGIYSINTQNKKLIKIRDDISQIVYSYKTVIQMHGFYINEKENSINFDIVIDFSDKHRHETLKKIYKEVQNKYPEYQLNITLDFDISD